MDNIIKENYEENNFPSSAKLYKIMKKKDINITLIQIKTFLDKQSVEQVTKIKRKKQKGHIVAFFPNQFWQMDIFDLSKYEKYNSGYKYILSIIDVFTRKAYLMAMKYKNETDVVNSFNKIIEDNKILPVVITSDTDSTFLSNRVQNLFKKYDIIHNTVPIGDHASLGIIDRFALTLKRILTKQRQVLNTANWIDNLNKIVKSYNNSENRGINDLTPNEANEEKNKNLLYDININKSKKNVIDSDLKKGDKVRLLITKLFKKGSEERFSKEIYIVDSAIGRTIHLEGGMIKSRDMLLKIDKDTINMASGITEKVTKERTVKRKLNNEGVEEGNIVINRTRGNKVKVY
jgi:hypothetical protein